MVLKKLIARVLRALPSLPPGTIGEDDVIDLLNEGLLNISAMSSKTSTLTYEMEVGTDSVPFPVDMLKIVNAYWGDDKVELDAEMDNMPRDVSGDPTGFYVEDGRIVLRPIPSVAGELYIVYTTKPTVMKEDTDTPDIEGTDEYLIAYALHRIHMEANSPAMQMWEAEKYRSMSMFVAINDDNYRTPFKVIPRW